MKRAVLLACLVALASPVHAQAPGDTGGRVDTQPERDATAARVRAGASCPGCDLFQIDLAYANVSGRDFSGARIRQSNLTVAIADRTNFNGANLSLANLFGIRASSADFRQANLNGAALVGGYFGGARFNGATLVGANLSGAEMARARGLTQAQLEGACGDASTQLPPGLTVGRCQ